jgi:hypothetical protein
MSPSLGSLATTMLSLREKGEIKLIDVAGAREEILLPAAGVGHVLPVPPTATWQRPYRSIRWRGEVSEIPKIRSEQRMKQMRQLAFLQNRRAFTALNLFEQFLGKFRKESRRTAVLIARRVLSLVLLADVLVPDFRIPLDELRHELLARVQVEIHNFDACT